MVGISQVRRQLYFVHSHGGGRVLPATTRTLTRLEGLDCALIFLFMLGLYTNYTIYISAKVPFPSVPSGIAGIVLLWRRRDLIRPAHLAGLFGVLALYLISILWATNIEFLRGHIEAIPLPAASVDVVIENKEQLQIMRK